MSQMYYYTPTTAHDHNLWAPLVFATVIPISQSYHVITALFNKAIMAKVMTIKGEGSDIANPEDKVSVALIK